MLFELNSEEIMKMVHFCRSFQKLKSGLHFSEIWGI